MDPAHWTSLPDAVRRRIDDLIAQDKRIHAVAALREALPEPKPGLHDCLDAIAQRFRDLGRRFEPWPTPPLDAQALAATAAALPGTLVAIEALWDGDTFGWHVRLVAHTDAPHREHHLATIRHGGDGRLFTGEVPPWPEAQEANAVGTALAEHFAVPFHFPNPHTPDDTAPRWRTSP